MKEAYNGDEQILVGISTCLLGQKVRFDGGHKRDRYITDILGAYFTFVPVCPELEVGMGVPRESVKLIGDPLSPDMIGNTTGQDWTTRMNTYAARRVRADDLKMLSGYVLKKDSPSCGMERVKVYDANKMPQKSGQGIYARHLMEQFPHLPIEEEGRLNDPRLRENFIERVFAYHRLHTLYSHGYSSGNMVRFHTIHKYLLLAHSAKHYQLMGKLVAEIKTYPPAQFRAKYEELFMEGLKIKTTVRKNVNVLQHIMGFMKDRLDPEDKRYVLSIIEDYRQEIVPLIVPLTLIRHYVSKFEIEYIIDQVYLTPHPKELMLRNHV